MCKQLCCLRCMAFLYTNHQVANSASLATSSCACRVQDTPDSTAAHALADALLQTVMQLHPAQSAAAVGHLVPSSGPSSPISLAECTAHAQAQLLLMRVQVLHMCIGADLADAWHSILMLKSLSRSSGAGSYAAPSGCCCWQAGSCCICRGCGKSG